jgi:hypothetical protein
MKGFVGGVTTTFLGDFGFGSSIFSIVSVG